jgi:hypothetical protein
MLSVCLLIVLAPAPDDPKQPTSKITYLGTIKGEIDKVSDAGRKIEVKYKELVSTSRTITMPRGTGGKFRGTPPKELVMKEKNQELQLRLHDETIIRILDEASEPKSNSKKKSKGEEGKKDEEADDDKSSKKNSSKSKKTTEPQHPGKPGTPESLVKGQIVLVSIAREDLPGYSRLIATTIYIMGEK